MTEEKQKQVAVFRFGIIHDLIGGTRLEHGEQEELLREKCERKWAIPSSNRTRLSRGTILRWVRIYTSSGGKLEALYPQRRRVLSNSYDLSTRFSGCERIFQRQRCPSSRPCGSCWQSS